MKDPRFLNKRVIFFDESCLLCNYFCFFVLKHMHPKKPIYFSFLKKIDQDKKTVLFLEKDKIYKKSSAVLRIFLLLKFPFCLFYVFYLIPFFIRDPIYDLIARFRYLIFKKTECFVLDEKQKKYFIL